MMYDQQGIIFAPTFGELDEKECIFPFYFDGQLVNDCIQLGKNI